MADRRDLADTINPLESGSSVALARARLRGSELTYRMLVEHVPAVTYVQAYDEAASAIYMSPQIEQLAGYTPDEWLADPDLWLKLIHPDDIARVTEEHLRTNSTGEPFRIEYRLLARDGHVVWVRDEGIVVHDEDGTPLYWQGVFLDITERVVVQEAGAGRETLQRLKHLGVLIAIDDFGIGYSSLAYLTRLDADTLKVDRSFVASIGKDARALSIVGAVATLAHALSMDVIAEGIENVEQLGLIRGIGCDHGQGYYFSRPLPAEEIAAMLTGQRLAAAPMVAPGTGT